jgi:hypothetical protein
MQNAIRATERKIPQIGGTPSTPERSLEYLQVYSDSCLGHELCILGIEKKQRGRGIDRTLALTLPLKLLFGIGQHWW